MRKCGKIKHETQREAETSMRHVLQAKGNKDGAKMSVYHCPDCGGWHWGRISEKLGRKKAIKRYRREGNINAGSVGHLRRADLYCVVDKVTSETLLR